MNVLRKLDKSVAFYSKFATFITYLKNRIFFKKTHPFIKEKNTFRKFREFLLFQWPCSVNLLLLAILRKSTIFAITQSVFFSKKTNFWTFWEILLSRLHSASTWLLLAVLKKTPDCFLKNQSFFLKKEPLFQRFGRSY